MSYQAHRHASQSTLSPHSPVYQHFASQP
jgi:hypothetical protein